MYTLNLLNREESVLALLSLVTTAAVDIFGTGLHQILAQTFPFRVGNKGLCGLKLLHGLQLFHPNPIINSIWSQSQQSLGEGRLFLGKVVCPSHRI